MSRHILRWGLVPLAGTIGYNVYSKRVACDQRYQLARVTQYHCELQPGRIVCQPIERIFRIMPGRPAVEVTHVVEYDGDTPFLPPHMENAMPPSQHWHELRADL